MFGIEHVQEVKRKWRLAIFVLLSALGVPGEAVSQSLDRVAVLYPQTTPPYDSVFTSIVDGIESELTPGRVRTHAVKSSTTDAALRNWIIEQRPAAVITLGRAPYERFNALKIDLPQVIGALDAGPDTHAGISGISLSAEPDLLLERLQRLSPTTQRILVIFDPRRDQWLIDRARSAAQKRGLAVEAYEARNLREASKHFLNIFVYANPRTDALWLLMNNTLVDDNNLPAIIERSWKRAMVVFSNNLEHANRGVLFAVFPDAEELGRRLATLATNKAADPKQPSEIQPLKDIRDALNVRVSDHLDLNVPAHVRADFDLIFGTR